MNFKMNANNFIVLLVFLFLLFANCWSFSQSGIQMSVGTQFIVSECFNQRNFNCQKKPPPNPQLTNEQRIICKDEQNLRTTIHQPDSISDDRDLRQRQQKYEDEYFPIDRQQLEECIFSISLKQIEFMLKQVLIVTVLIHFKIIVKFLKNYIWLASLFLVLTTMIIFALYEEIVIPQITNPYLKFLNDNFLSPIKQKITEYYHNLLRTNSTFNNLLSIN